MSLINILAFSGAMFLFALSPGPGLFAIISNALSSSFKNTSFLVMGMVLGDIVFLLLANIQAETLAL